MNPPLDEQNRPDYEVTPAVQDVTDSLREVQALLAQQKRVESLVHRQDSPRRELVENLVHKQHLAALRDKLVQLSAADVARILEALPQDESLLIWELVAPERGEEVLDELSDTVRETLAATQPLERKAVVLNAFELENGRLRQVPITSKTALAAATPIWIDLIAPSKEERGWIREIFDLALPDTDDLSDLEESARFYIEDNGEVHLHSDFLLDKDGEARNVAVAFILHRNILFSVRDEELPVFRLQRLRARIQPGYVSNGTDVLLDLYAADVEYSADTLEEVYAGLEAVGRKVLSTQVTDAEAASILADIAREEDLNGRIRRNVLDTRRALSFLMRGRLLAASQHEDARQILRDIDSLDGHTAFIFNKINFLMDATVGFININQNKIIKIFSVASVALLPPTLIASVYGMNFRAMPELDWPWGYPFSLALMAVSVAVPFAVFRRKGWLR
ncbi:MAG: magnesium and cobalt transport protein CorA [Betaproteobacteria bacterium HGW-Betaproteobacteria-11]|nr:MAG: magnesium and cobalt transport protein CorA [Betaproteobacteria bacterium HGW-Betaproteobacteria-11]